MTDLEQQLLQALEKAYYELNEIRARDGVPYKYDGTKSSVDEQYFSDVVDECSEAIKTGNKKLHG